MQKGPGRRVYPVAQLLLQPQLRTNKVIQTFNDEDEENKHNVFQIGGGFATPAGHVSLRPRLSSYVETLAVIATTCAVNVD